MKKALLMFSVFLTCQSAFAQLVTEYWDIAQTKKKSEQQMKNGMQDGKFTAWYENGELAKEGSFAEGK
jgi:hypothetical protein